MLINILKFSKKQYPKVHYRICNDYIMFSLLNYMELLKNGLNLYLLLLGKIQGLYYEPEKTIYINGSPRSGTTWLGELFAQIPKTAILWEPFHIRNQKVLLKKGFDWRTYIEPLNPDYRKMQYIEEMILGMHLNMHNTRFISNRQILTKERWIVKSVRSHWFLNTISEQFNINPPIHLLRHPCATISSQIHRRTTHKRINERQVIQEWEQGYSTTIRNFLSRNPQYEEFLGSLNTWEEILAVKWCIDNYEVFKSKKELPYVILPYEKIVTSGDQVMKKLLLHYKIPWNDNYLKGLKIPSSTVVEGSNIEKDKNPLSGWTEKLDSNQSNRILSVVKYFGCNFYTRNLEPNYKELNYISKLKI